MRTSAANGVAYPGAVCPVPRSSRWLQAGFKSFAYRLAHLALPRPAMIAAVAAMFYLA
jgi:hypothetical protein